jgi:hypothetical protein
MFADVIVDDREDRPFMLVEVKALVDSSEVLREFVEQLNHADSSISFGMLVDLENIYLLKRDSSQGTFVNLVRLKTKEVLRHYAPDFAGTESRYVSSSIFHDYFETLVEGWLRDLAYHWKSTHPPGAEALAATGLIQRIENGMTRRTEAVAGGSPLS